MSGELTKGWTWHGVLSGLAGGFVGFYLSFGWHPFITAAVIIIGIFGGTLASDLLVKGFHRMREAGG